MPADATETPTSITLGLKRPALVPLPASGELTIRMPGAEYALVLLSSGRVYLPRVEGQHRVEIRPKEDLRIKSSSQKICGDPGQRVWLCAAPRGEAIPDEVWAAAEAELRGGQAAVAEQAPRAARKAR